MIAGLLLAAGRSKRFGADKLLAKLRGKAVIRWSAESLAAGVDELYVVLPPAADTMTQALARLDARFVVNLSRDEGMGSSICAGVAAMPAETEAIVIALGDQPLADPTTVDAVIAKWRTDGSRAVTTWYDDGQGHPVLFARDCFALLSALRGDVGARAVLESLGARVSVVRVESPMPVDVDTPDALREVEMSLR